MADVLIDLGEAAPLDRSSIVQRAYEYLAANMPGGYTPRTGRLDDLILNENAQETGEIAALLSAFGMAVFRYYGLKVVRVQPIESQPAQALATWKAPDTTGHTIPAGTEVSIDGVGFATTTDVVIAPGSDEAKHVLAIAQTSGTVGNELSGEVQVRDQLDVEFTVTLEAPTSKGQDAEGDQAYLERLLEELKLVTRSAITSDDFARLAALVDGVGRVLALNMHNAETGEDNVECCITIAPQNDSDGGPVSAEAKAAIEALAGERRVLPIRVFVVDANYVSVDVAATVLYWPGYESATVGKEVEDLLAAFLDPLTFGSPQQGETQSFAAQTTLSLFQVAGVIERAAGVQRVTAVALNGKAEDLALAGVMPLPEAGEFAITAEPA